MPAIDTWTIVDTVRPGSHVNALSQYQNRSAFLVSWGPDVGVTDIASYTIQSNAGAAGWTNWLVGTPATAGTFTASCQGFYPFRSIPTDLAANCQCHPASN